MTDTKKSTVPHTVVHDITGLGLIAASALLGTSSVMFITKGPTENQATYGELMSGFIQFLGAAPILWLCLGLLFIGVRLFMSGGERGLGRDAVGFAATALGLSILLGAFSPTLGGSVGAMVGWEMSQLGTVVAGALLGFAALLVPAWVIWLRVAPPALVERVSSLIGETPTAETAAPTSAARGTRNAPPAKARTEDPSGVTSAEASALLPDPERDEILEALRSSNRNNPSSVNRAPSPYPEDVRRGGGIPAGAQPIDIIHESRTAAPAAGPLATPVAVRGSPAPAVKSDAPVAGGASRPGSVYTWSAPKVDAAPVRTGADLAGAKDARGPGAAQVAPKSTELKSPLAVGRGPVSATPITSPDRPLGAPSWESELEPEPEVLEMPAAVASKSIEVEVEAEPPGDAEVVDAYGTPLELVAELRGKSRESELPLAESAPAAAIASEPAHVENDVEGDLEAQTEDEQAEDEAEFDSEPDLDADEESEAPDFEDDPQAELEPDIDEVSTPAVAFAIASPPAPAAGATQEAPKAAASAPARREREVVLQPVQSDLFDGPQKPAPKSEPVERTVTLAPKPSAKLPMQPAAEGEELLQRSAELFLKHQRVAVSMLQREFGLDFKQATEVLDQLQEQGLIGPYLGGQRRDILLTAEEWRAKVGAAS